MELESPIVNLGKIIDRIDLRKVDIPVNVVPGCIICNQAKTDLTLEDFFSWLSKAYHRSTYNFPNFKYEENPYR